MLFRSDQSVNHEGEEGDSNWDGVPDSHGKGPDDVLAAESLKLSLSLLVNNLAETLLPCEVLDDANVLQDLVGGVNTLIGSSHDLLLSPSKSKGKANIDWKQKDHDDQTWNRTESEDLIKQNNANHQLSRSRRKQEMQISTDLGNLEGIDRH